LLVAAGWNLSGVAPHHGYPMPCAALTRERRDAAWRGVSAGRYTSPLSLSFLCLVLGTTVTLTYLVACSLFCGGVLAGVQTRSSLHVKPLVWTAFWEGRAKNTILVAGAARWNGTPGGRPCGLWRCTGRGLLCELPATAFCNAPALLHLAISVCCPSFRHCGNAALGATFPAAHSPPTSMGAASGVAPLPSRSLQASATACSL